MDNSSRPFVSVSNCSFHIHQGFMCTLEERYAIERNREVKNIPLLKTLKEQLQKSFDVAAHRAHIRLELKEAELTEDWDKYATLQATLTGILVEGDVFLHATRSDVPNVGRDECTHEVTDDPTIGRDDVTLGVIDDTVRTLDSDSSADDEDEVDLRSGAMYGSPQELLKQLSDYANSRHFTVRREKHAIVCSNAGQSNWTSVSNYEARAQQAYRKIHKLQDQDIDLNIDDLLETEEDKVAPHHCL